MGMANVWDRHAGTDTHLQMLTSKRGAAKLALSLPVMKARMAGTFLGMCLLDLSLSSSLRAARRICK